MTNETVYYFNAVFKLYMSRVGVYKANYLWQIIDITLKKDISSRAQFNELHYAVQMLKN